MTTSLNKMAASTCARCTFSVTKFFFRRIRQPRAFSTEIDTKENYGDCISPLEKTLGKEAFARLIPKTKEEVEQIRRQRITNSDNSRILHVALLGLPNSGKSTLTNKLMGWRVCSVSAKVHTTRHKCKAILVEGNTQIIFVDTPGLVSLGEKNRFNLDESMVNDPQDSVQETDLAVVLIDVANKWTRQKLDPKILRILHLCKTKKSILVLNKVDALKSKRLLLNLTASLTKNEVGGQPITKTNPNQNKPKSGDELIQRTLEKLNIKQPDNQKIESQEENIADDAGGWPFFNRVFMISAEQNDGIDDLKRYILECAKPGPWVYPPSMVTDQSPTEIAIMAVKEKLLDYLPQEIPYSVKLKIEMWEVDQHGVLRIVILILCPRKGMMKFLLGPKGKMVSRVAEEARQELLNTFRCEISLKLIVQHQNQ